MLLVMFTINFYLLVVSTARSLLPKPGVFLYGIRDDLYEPPTSIEIVFYSIYDSEAYLYKFKPLDNSYMHAPIEIIYILHGITLDIVTFDTFI